MPRADTGWPVLAAPAAFWLLFVVAFTVLQWPSLGNLEMQDSDDYVRLHQADEYSRHRQWYNFTLQRMNPPAGTSMHWSRLPDVPLALTLSSLRPLLGEHRAALAAIIVVPSLLLLLTLYCLWAGLRVSTQPQAAGIAVLYVLICLPVVSKVAPGKLDHHAWQVMLVTALWACTAVGARTQRDAFAGSAAGVVAGIAAATSLWIGLEVLPLLLALLLFVHLEWIYGNDRIARFGLAFGLSLGLASALALLLHVPPSQRLVAACDTYAVNWLRVAWGIALACAVLPLLGARWGGPRQRFALSVALAALFAVVVLARDASCIFLGPYADMPARLHEQLLANIYEARSAYALAVQSPALLVMFFGFPMLTLVVALAERTSLRADAVCRLSFLLTLCALCMSLWQIRAVYFAGLCTAPLAAILAQSLMNRRGEKNAALWPAIMVMLLLSPMVSLLLGVTMDRLWSSHDASAAHELSIAQIDAAVAVIDQQHYAGAPAAALIAAPLNAGPAILARSKHAILGAPYHRNVGGINQWLDMRAAQDEATLRQLLFAARVDFLLLPKLAQVGTNAGLIEQVAGGKRLAWLRRLPTPSAEATLLFQVLAESAGQRQQSSPPRQAHSSTASPTGIGKYNEP